MTTEDRNLVVGAMDSERLWRIMAIAGRTASGSFSKWRSRFEKFLAKIRTWLLKQDEGSRIEIRKDAENE